MGQAQILKCVVGHDDLLLHASLVGVLSKRQYQSHTHTHIHVIGTAMMIKKKTMLWLWRSETTVVRVQDWFPPLHPASHTHPSKRHRDNVLNPSSFLLPYICDDAYLQ